MDINFIYNMASSELKSFLAASDGNSLVTGINSKSEYILNHVLNYVMNCLFY